MFTKNSISRIFSVLFALVLILSLTGQAQAAKVSPSSAIPIMVNSTADTQAEDGQCTLREAILNANGNNQSGSTDCASGGGADTINFSLSSIPVITLTSELPAIADDLTIEGNHWESISGDDAYRILSLNTGVSLALSRLLLFHGNPSSGHGGAIDSNGGILSVTNCDFQENNALGSGGAIHNGGGSLTVTQSTFPDNQANYGGAIDSGEGSLSVTESYFRNNTATSGGGAINNSHSTTHSVLIKDSKFEGNTAGYGGAVRNDNTGIVNITNSSFHENTASEAGAVNNYLGTTYIANSSFSDNSATANGGSLSNSGGMLTVTNSTFVSSNAIASGTLRNFSGTATLRNTILANSGGNNCQVDAGTLTAGADNLAFDASCASATQTTLANLKLGPLQDNGGDTLTFALLPGSPAIDTGDDATCGTALVGGMDQRGVTRPQGAHCDVGAYERQQISGILYAIPEEGAASGICDSWVSACDLQYALSIAASGAEIWTQAGTYTPTSESDRWDTFQLKNGVALYGGFAGTETARSQRDPATNVTTLSGDLNGDDGPDFANNSENSYHVVTGSGTNASALLDGFTITSGNANSAYPNNAGGGMYNDGGSPTITNLTFSGNRAGFGGGMSNENSSPMVANVTFSGNTATNDGGGMCNFYSSPTVTNVTFSGNSAGYGYGGGMYNYDSSPTVTNVTFSGNSADESGGGMHNYYFSSPTVTNVTFSGNSAGSGGGMYNDYQSSPTVTNVTFSGNSTTAYGGGIFNNSQSSPLIRNSILWGNVATTSGSQVYNTPNSTPAISYSDVQGGYVGTGNISADPLLGVLGGYGGNTQVFPLLPGSPAINTGGTLNCPATDQRGAARPQGATCDMGAYEADVTAPGIKSITRINASPTPLTSVGFTVTFSEPVTDVDAADFKLTNTMLTGASVSGVGGTGAVYTVTVNTGTGNGTIRLDIPVTASIQDLAGNAFVGPYSGGQVYTINKGTAPTVPVLMSPANGFLVTSYLPTLDWNESSQVMALAILGWHYEIQVTSPDGYNLFINTVEKPDPLLGLGASQYTFTSPLPANTTFSWKVRAYNDNNQYSAWSASRTFRTKLTTSMLNSPVNGATLNNKRPTFDWDEVPGAMTYTLQVLSGAKVVHTGAIKAPAYTYMPTVDLLPSTIYTWKVKANGTNPGDYSAPFTFTTSPNPPKPPVLLAPTNSVLVDSAVSQILKWSPVLAVTTTSPATTYPAAQSYEVEYAMNSTFTGTSDTFVTVNAPTTEKSITLLPGRTYYWRVRAWSGAGATRNHSAWSLVRTIKVKFGTPSLTSPAAGATGVGVRPNFTWNSTNGLWTSYTLQIAPTNAFSTGTRSFTVIAPVTTFTIPDSLPALTAGVTYYWRVKINGLYTSITSATRSFVP